MFNKFRIGAACVVLVSALGMAGTANAATTASADAQAVILDPLAITTDSVLLDFGTIAVNAAGTASVDAAAGGLTCTAANLVCVGGGTRPSFTVTGAPNQNVQVTIPASVTLNGSGGGTMTLTPSNDLVGTPNTGGAGSFGFHVGGSIGVLAAQTAGTYTASFNVAVAYQ